MDILSTKTQTAKKTHRCNYCLGKINIGEPYEYSAIINDGDFYTWKSHIPCKEIALHLNMFRESSEYGLDSDSFQELINIEYENIIKKTSPDVWRSKQFEEPGFNTQLSLVLEHHKIKKPIVELIK